MTSRPIIISADDYAMDAGVDAGILDLARKGIVTATSAMVLSPSWPEAALRIKDAPVDCGLHLDLTSPFARNSSWPDLLGRRSSQTKESNKSDSNDASLTGRVKPDHDPCDYANPSLSGDGKDWNPRIRVDDGRASGGVYSPLYSASLLQLILAAQLRLLPRPAIRHAIDGQLGLFDQKMHSPPRFVDGHQHVHHLPVVRTELLAALRSRYGTEMGRIALRDCRPRAWQGLKAAIIAATGAGALARLTAREVIQTNSDFAGVYDFRKSASLPELWSGWLATLAGPQPLVMCHPAMFIMGQGIPWDTIRDARVKEHHWLASDAFRDLCRQHGVVPSRWTPVTER